MWLSECLAKLPNGQMINQPLGHLVKQIVLLCVTVQFLNSPKKRPQVVLAGKWQTPANPNLVSNEARHHVECGGATHYTHNPSTEIWVVLKTLLNLSQFNLSFWQPITHIASSMYLFGSGVKTLSY